ncbi:hypothetical protein [Garciella nitratireducens]|uniref:hypothetical protein n=1 Tax=Garciella nitratireducens TaxID=218205 RepID=UPI00117BD963|nr:hypothetical protein [Garciella nitratireducens]
MLTLFAGVVYAGSGSYSSTYSMTGGVYSRQMDTGDNPKFTVSVRPTKWSFNGAKMTLFL